MAPFKRANPNALRNACNQGQVLGAVAERVGESATYQKAPFFRTLMAHINEPV